jgi:S-formylglutathione hydrolase FrmB
MWKRHRPGWLAALISGAVGVSLLASTATAATTTSATATAATATAATTVSGVPLAANTSPTVAFQNGDGITLTSEAQADPRLIDMTVTTPAVAGTLHVDVLLPTNYDPSTHYPVLYLFHGTAGTASDWANYGQVEQTTAGLPLIVVMPDASLNDNGGSWCSNWVDQSAGAANWETFHIDELVPWIDSNLPTIADRQGRAIAGLSMGGFCSTSYAAQFPDLFETVLGFSPAPDIAYDKQAQAGAALIIGATEVGEDHVAPASIFGDPATDEINWAAHDPTTLAENLADTNILLFNGNGLPGPLDPSPVTDPKELESYPGAGLIEGAVNVDTTLFHNRLDALGISSYWDNYGDGTHSWPYWTRDLQQSIGTVMTDFANPLPNPSKVTYTTASADYTTYGWQVSMQRTAEEFSTLEDAAASGFELAGSGSGLVVTPADYTAGGEYDVTIAEESAAPVVEQLQADGTGALHITVPLGPANPYQEYTVQGDAVGTKVYTTTVSIVPAT